MQKNDIRLTIHKLFEQIKNKDGNRSVFDGFIAFSEYLKVNAWNNMEFLQIFECLGDNPIIPNVPAEGKRREKMVEYFIEMLRNYRNGVQYAEDRSNIEVEDLIKKSEMLLEQMRQINCFDCGAIISSKENRCSKCGWTWNPPRSKET